MWIPSLKINIWICSIKITERNEEKSLYSVFSSEEDACAGAYFIYKKENEVKVCGLKKF